MQILTNGVWADSALDPIGEGTERERYKRMLDSGYGHPIEMGGSDNGVTIWTAMSSKTVPAYVFDVRYGGGGLDLGAATFADFIALQSQMAQLVHNSMVLDLVDQLFSGPADLEELLRHIRKEQRNG